MLAFVDTPPPTRPGLPPGGAPDRPPFGLPDAVVPQSAEAAGRLAEPGALVVTTGQQPGLFLGPLYTLHKALSARAVASALEAAWGRPVVPVFWIAGDDHDFAEGAAVSWLGADGSPVTAALQARPDDAPLVPMYREPVPPDVADLLALLEASAPPGAERDATLAWLGRHYRAGQTLAGAFGGALAELLAPLGIVCLDGSHPSVKRAAWPVMRAALEQTASLDGLLDRRHGELTAAGADPGVKVGDGATLVMIEGALGRDRLLPSEGGFVTRRSGEAFSLVELERIARDEPVRLSANVLLRPVVEAAVLPTVAYVAGPGELRYLALAAALYGPLGVRPQAALPRWSGLVIEPRVTRTLSKLGLSLEEVRTGPPQSLEQHLARQLAPPGFEPAVEDVRRSIERGFDALSAEIRAIDPTLEKPARSTMGHALNGLADLEKRVLQAIKRRQADAIAQLERVQAAVQPDGRPQERGLGAVGFLARYGSGWIRDLGDHVADWYRGTLEAPTPSL